LEGGILGRTDDMVIVRGVNVYPTAIEQIVRSCPHVAEYQVAVRETAMMTELEVLLEPTADCTDAAVMVNKLESDLRAMFSLRIAVKLARPGSLPRFEMKARRWVRTTPVQPQACAARASCAACDGEEKQPAGITDE
jgi:phenylacetate-CoA ligase